ncbi:hypothetical protein F4810DRAFT_663983 [Camillea tinctor]|nr:hypothetical protein F4810DRAFT_663983 [Camillea tinctor]
MEWWCILYLPRVYYLGRLNVLLLGLHTYVYTPFSFGVVWFWVDAFRRLIIQFVSLLSTSLSLSQFLFFFG